MDVRAVVRRLRRRRSRWGCVTNISSWAKVRMLPWVFLTYYLPQLSPRWKKKITDNICIRNNHPTSLREPISFLLYENDTINSGGMTGLSSNAEPGVLATARYGKDKVRVFRVVRDLESKVHNVVEYNVTVLLEGAIETRCGWQRCPVAIRFQS